MYKLILEIKDIGDFQQDLEKTKLISLDTESTGLDFFVDTLLLISIRLNDKIYIVDVQKFGQKNTTYLVSLINSSNKLVIGHNIKYDAKVLKHNTGEMLQNVYDTMVAESLIYKGLDGNFYSSLSSLVSKYCNIILDKDIREEFIDDTRITEEKLIYAAKDVLYLEDIRKQQLSKLAEQEQLDTVNLEMSIVTVTAEMEFEGVHLNKEHWLHLEELAKRGAVEQREKFVSLLFDKLNFTKFSNAYELFDYLIIPVSTKRLKAQLESITDLDSIRDFAREKFNLNSPQQVKNVLNKVFKLNISSTGEKILIKHPNDITKCLLEYRGFGKKVSTYGSSFLNNVHPVTGKIHSEWNQIGTDTGRYSSDKPNLQNIISDSDETPPEESYRTAFDASDEDYLIITADYSQAELRLLGAVSKDPLLIHAFQNDLDLHKFTAANLFDIAFEEVTKDQRKIGKTLNFAVVYGTTEWGLWINFGIPMDEGKNYLWKFFKGKNGYKTLDHFITLAGDKIWELKYSKTPLGRKRFFSDRIIYDNPKQREKYVAEVKRQGINHIIQGGSADIVKIAMKDIYYNNPFNDKLKIIMQIHDEIVCKVHKDIAEEAKEFIRTKMLEAEQPFLKEIPAKLDIEVAPYWTK